MKKIKVLYLNVNENKKPEVLTIEKDYRKFHDLIDCDALDSTRRKISGKWYWVICDDLGRLRARPKLSMIDAAMDYPLAGNLIIAGTEDEEGDLTSLSDKDVAAIMERVLKWGDQYIITQAEKFDNAPGAKELLVPPPGPGDFMFIDLPIGGRKDG